MITNKQTNTNTQHCKQRHVDRRRRRLNWRRLTKDRLLSWEQLDLWNEIDWQKASSSARLIHSDRLAMSVLTDQVIWKLLSYQCRNGLRPSTREQWEPSSVQRLLLTFLVVGFIACFVKLFIKFIIWFTTRRACAAAAANDNDDDDDDDDDDDNHRYWDSLGSAA